MKVFSLDLSTRVGWCFFAAPDAVPKFGTFVLKKPYDPDDIGSKLLPLRFWLREMVALYRPDCLAFEAPWIAAPRHGEVVKITTTAQVMRGQVALATEVEVTAKECAVGRILEVAGSSAKLALAGSARLGDEKKRAMVLAALRRGWRVADDHQADAGAVALVAYSSLGLDVPEPGEVTS